MRTVNVKTGKFKGEYIIFDSVEEAKNSLKVDPKKPWHAAETCVGDWVVADDGYVLECLNRYQLINKRHKQGQYTDVFKFATGTYGVYYDRHGVSSPPYLFAQLTKSNRVSVGNTPPEGRFMGARKRHFVELVKGGLNPFEAYIIAFKINCMSPGAILSKTNALLQDDLIRKELMSEAKSLTIEFNKQIKERTGFDDLQSFIAYKLAEATCESPKYLKEKIQQANLLIKLADVLGALPTSKKESKIKEMQEAEWSEALSPIIELTNNKEEPSDGNINN